ncbi:MAG: thioredoxin family protein [Methylacidiphilales bacterium]|nr:thioredoxin family protein [Candidatus Methylacidiphilales bacterium]
MKSKFLLCLATVFAATILSPALSSAAESSLNWLTSSPAALAKAKNENKKVLIDFTGSDWCGWCMKLDREVFSTPEFAAYAAKNLVLLQVDFPRTRHQSDDQKQANQKLAQQYGIQGYPTIIVLNSGGNKVGELGYMPGGPQAFISALEKLK